MDDIKVFFTNELKKEKCPYYSLDKANESLNDICSKSQYCPFKKAMTDDKGNIKSVCYL